MGQVTGTSKGIANNNVTLVLNWFEELKQRVPVGRWASSTR